MNIEVILFEISQRIMNGARLNQKGWHHLSKDQKIDAIVEYLGQLENRLRQIEPGVK